MRAKRNQQKRPLGAAGPKVVKKFKPVGGRQSDGGAAQAYTDLTDSELTAWVLGSRDEDYPTFLESVVLAADVFDERDRSRPDGHKRSPACRSTTAPRPILYWRDTP